MIDSELSEPGHASREAVKFVHCSDIHLGASFSMLPRSAADRRRVDQRQTFARIVDLALQHTGKADMVFISGDLFDSARPSPRDVAFVRSQLQRLADGNVQTFIIPGNHDHCREGGFWLKADFPCTKLFTKPAFECCEAANMGISVCGIAPDISQPSRNQISLFDAELPPGNSVLLFHGSWLNFGQATADCHPFTTEDLAELPFSYIALGHYHALRTVEGIRPVAMYPGAPDAIGFSKNDLGDRYVVVGTIDSRGRVDAKPHKINLVSHLAQEIDCTAETEQSLRRRLEEMLSAEIYAQIQLAGNPPAEVITAAEHLADELQQFCSYLDISTSFGSVGEVPADNTYMTRFVQIMNDRIQAASENERPLLSKALELGVRAFMRSE